MSRFVLPRSGSNSAFRFTLCLYLLCIFAPSAKSQSDPAAGILPFSTRIQGITESVDLASGSITVLIPVRGKAGKLQFSYNLVMNNHPVLLSGQWNVSTSLVPRSSTSVLDAYVSAPSIPSGNCNGVIKSFGSFVVRDSTGATHNTNLNVNCPGTYSGATIDGTGYTVVVTLVAPGIFTATLYDKSGNRQTSSDLLDPPALATLTDPDGVTLTRATTVSSGGTTSVYTDSLGQTALTAHYQTPYPPQDTYTYNDESGNPQSVVVSYSLFTTKVNFCSNQHEINRYLPVSVQIPGLGILSITYETSPGSAPDVTGRIQSITYPSGGSVTYAYAGGTIGNGLNCTSRVVPTLTRTINDNNGNIGTYTYVNNNNNSTTTGAPIGNYTVTETTPPRPGNTSGDTITYHFNGEFETQRIVTDVNLGVLTTTVTCYNAHNTSQAACIAPTSNILGPITQTDVYTSLGTQTPSLKETVFDTHGNTTSVSKYDVGATYPPSGSPASKITYSYDLAAGPCGTLSIAYMYDRPCTVTVSSPTAQVGQTKYTYNSSGHATTTSKWIAGTTFSTSSASFNANGTVHTTTDANGNVTTLNYDGSCNGILSTGTTPPAVNGIALTTSQTWDCNGGVVSSSTDANGRPTVFSYADPQWRRTHVSYPDGGTTTSIYSSGAPWAVSVTTSVTGTTNVSRSTTLDGLGRPIHAQLTSDPDGVDMTDTTYDNLGRVATVSNPHRSTSSSSDGTTAYKYDASGRPVLITRADGSAISTSYSNNCVTVTDEAGRPRSSCTDGLGRLTAVFEDPGTAPHLNYETDYAFDALDNLLSVNQKGGSTNPADWRTRTFVYDGLSRLVQSTNPEPGTISYFYDSDGNLTSKTAPAPNQQGALTVNLSYCYDALNRMTSKAYTAQACPMTSPADSYFYDQTNYNGLPIVNGLGRRTGMLDQTGMSAWSYDPMGRVLTEQRKTASITKATGYTYNLDGSLASMTYPGGHVFTYLPGGAGRQLSVRDSTAGVDLLTNIHYSPAGAVTSVTSGANLSTTYIYNSRLQPCWTYTTTGTPLSWNATPCTGGAPTGNILDMKYDFALGAGDNGNVVGITNNRDTTRSEMFAYDQLNRLASAQTTSTHATSPTHCWGESYAYDSATGGAWGNLIQINVSSSAYNGCTQETLSLTVDTHNRISTDTYDSAGNVISSPAPGAATYTYSAENQMIKAVTSSTTQYGYDGDGRRVEKQDGSGQPTKLYWYDSSGNVVNESDAAGIFTDSYIFFDAHVAAHSTSSGTFYNFNDIIRTARLIVQSGQTAPCYDADFYPFGGERSYTSSCGENYKFSGKERDPESNLDNFGARYYSSAIGRFMSSDWSAAIVSVPYASLTDPQSLNLYSYVENNPLSRTDPTGHCSIDGETHGFWWCVGHALGLKETSKEYEARVATERQWLINNVAINPGDANALRHFSSSQIHSLYGQWDLALHNAACGGFNICEEVPSAKDYRRTANGAFVLYRGGSSFDPRPGEFKLDVDGNVKPTRGVSVNTDPAKVEPFGGANEVKFVPPELQMVQVGGDLGHFEIVPREPMSVSRFLELLRDIITEPFEKPTE